MSSEHQLRPKERLETLAHVISLVVFTTSSNSEYVTFSRDLNLVTGETCKSSSGLSVLIDTDDIVRWVVGIVILKGVQTTESSPTDIDTVVLF